MSYKQIEKLNALLEKAAEKLQENTHSTNTALNKAVKLLKDEYNTMLTSGYDGKKTLEKEIKTYLGETPEKRKALETTFEQIYNAIVHPKDITRDDENIYPNTPVSEESISGFDDNKY